MHGRCFASKCSAIMIPGVSGGCIKQQEVQLRLNRVDFTALAYYGFTFLVVSLIAFYDCVTVINLYTYRTVRVKTVPSRWARYSERLRCHPSQSTNRLIYNNRLTWVKGNSNIKRASGLILPPKARPCLNPEKTTVARFSPTTVVLHPNGAYSKCARSA